VLGRTSETDAVAVGLAGDRIDVVHLRRSAAGSLSLVRCESRRHMHPDAATLTALRKEMKLQRFSCVAPLQAGEYQMLQVEPPAVSAEEMKAAIRWRIRDLIDYPAEEATVDVLEIPEDARAGGRPRFMFVASAPNAVIQRYVRLFQAAGIPLEVIDIPELAQRNLANLFEPEGRGIAFLSFDRSGSLLTVSSGGELYLARRIEITLEQLADADSEQRSAIFERLLVELQRSLDNLERQFRSVSVAKLMLARIPESVPLREYLAQNLYLPVETADLAGLIDLSVAPDLDNPLRLSECLPLLGAALRELSQPPGARP